MRHARKTHRIAKARTHRGSQSGYAYIMALGMILILVAGSQVVLRNVVTEARSRREADMIWRGNQYVRAIRLYHSKKGNFPQTQDDLLTGVPDDHFLRAEAMKDPMNTSDGSWRFIYTNAAGSIIGSVKYGSLLQMALMDMNGGVMPGQQPSNGASATGPSTGLSAAPGIGSINASGATGTATGMSGGLFGLGQSSSSQQTNQTNAPGTTTILGPLGQPTTVAIAGPQPTGPVDTPPPGGLIVGVGSTVDKASVRVYKGGKKYNEWEFIWNPIEDQARQVQQGMSAGTTGMPNGSVPGLGLPLGSVPGTGIGNLGGTPNPANGTSSAPNSGSTNNSNSANPTPSQ
jgi:hypothetical protein